MKTNLSLILTAIAAFLLSGCVSNKQNVVVMTATYLGVQVAENPATSLYEAKIGYGRAEFAFVPGNTNNPASLPDVLLELKMDNVFKGGGIYQRLAVGRNAVTQPGASLMFLKNSDGTLDPKIAAEIMKQTPSPGAQVTSDKLPLAQAYQKAADKSPWDAVAKSLGYDTFAAFLTSSTVTSADVIKVSLALKAANLF